MPSINIITPEPADATSSTRCRSATTTLTNNALFGRHRPPLTDEQIRTCWARDDRTKTCKCETCGTRVRFWSWKCIHCKRHICSACAEPQDRPQDFPHRAARSHLDAGCWCLRFRSNMDPALAPSRRGHRAATKGDGRLDVDPTLERGQLMQTGGTRCLSRSSGPRDQSDDPKTPSPRRQVCGSKRLVGDDSDTLSGEEGRPAQKLNTLRQAEPDGHVFLESTNGGTAESPFLDR